MTRSAPSSMVTCGAWSSAAAMWRVVRVAVLALDGVGRDAVVRDQRGRHVVLRRERVRRAEDRIGSACLQRAHQVRRLGGDVQAGADAPARQRLLGGEPLADAGQHRHLPIRPFDLQRPRIGQADVGECRPLPRFAWPRQSQCLSYRSHETPSRRRAGGPGARTAAVLHGSRAGRRPRWPGRCRRAR